MKSAFLLLLALTMLGASLFFFYRSSALLVSNDYLAGLLHIFVGFATIRAGVELCRFAVVLHSRSR
jgi:hypothetical protein